MHAETRCALELKHDSSTVHTIIISVPFHDILILNVHVRRRREQQCDVTCYVELPLVEATGRDHSVMLLKNVLIPG